MLQILSKYPVRNPKVFGSVARGENAETSDPGILVEREGGIFRFNLVRMEDGFSPLTSARPDARMPGAFAPRASARIARGMRAL